MKKIITLFLCSAVFITTSAQWNPTIMSGGKLKPNGDVKSFYSLDIKQLKSTLTNAEETKKGAKPVIINLPTIEGNIEKFAVYSFPVVVKSLADQYDLGSYVGVGIDDPSKYVRFSVAPNDFQSMMIKNGVYQFIEPQNTDKSVYGVHLKTTNTGSKPFVCGTEEKTTSKEQMKELFKNGNNFTNQPTDFSRSSDKKYRTLRLAMSVTGEYTTYFGGVAPALAAINATLTRVNGVYENEFSLHLNLQNFPQLIYTDPLTDPYSPAEVGSKGTWNTELQNTLTSVIGNAAYDIGHLFGATGGGGNAGCIGCVCVDDTPLPTDKNKGSGFTSPANGIPMGDNFDIDYVAHEMGHQIGGNHTFSFKLEGTGVNIEPGSGSTIMGYAGITGATNDVQAHSDPYFSVASLIQIQTNLNFRTCDVEVPISNNPPVIAALADVTIPQGTAFLLTASASDPENNPLTYCWEEVDDAAVNINNTNLGTTTTGASFRSLNPTTSPIRYFPKFSTVLAGNVSNIADWEAVSTVARATKFRVTVRDNGGSTPGYQQTQNALQNVTVGSDGPFIITSTNVYNDKSAPLTWNVVNTAATPYNCANVKIDYTTNNGAKWTVVNASTPNDGTENLIFPGLVTGAVITVRVSSIGNVFYALKKLNVASLPICDGTPPSNLAASNITINSAQVSWDPIGSATYQLRYRVVGTSTWTTITSAAVNYNITGLIDKTQYEAQVASICSGTTGTFSASSNFTTLTLTYCTNASGSSAYEYISNVTVTPQGGGNVLNNNSAASTYTSYAADPAKLVNLVSNTNTNTISVSKSWSGTQSNESVFAWIDFNRDGVFDASEQIMATANNKTTPETVTFSVPANSYTGSQTLGMRVLLTNQPTQSSACAVFQYGEIEDYAVKISAPLSVNDSAQTQTLQVYPNPASDVLNITKVNSNAIYSIYNTTGQIVSKGKITDNKVQVSNLTKGIYIISIDNNGETTKVKFIKK